MAIDAFSEELLTLSDAAKLLPKRRRGRPVNTSTLYRWAVGGCRGVRLETIKVGGCSCTTRSALQRFFDKVTRAANPSCPQSTPAARQRAIDAAERELDEAGI